MLYNFWGMSLAFVARCGFVFPQSGTSGHKAALGQQLDRCSRPGSGSHGGCVAVGCSVV